MAAERIGVCKCPLCGHLQARVSLSKSGLTCMTCDGCNCQLFTRSGRSDELLRGRIQIAAPAPEPVRTEPAPAAPAVPPVRDVQKPAASPAAPAASGGFGLLKGWA